MTVRFFLDKDKNLHTRLGSVARNHYQLIVLIADVTKHCSEFLLIFYTNVCFSEKWNKWNFNCEQQTTVVFTLHMNTTESCKVVETYTEYGMYALHGIE